MEIYVDDEAKLTLHGLVQVIFQYFSLNIFLMVFIFIFCVYLFEWFMI